MNFDRILIFRIGHLGDTVIAMPALRIIRARFPSSRLTLLTNIDVRNPNYVSPLAVLPGDGLIDDSIAYPTNLVFFDRTFAFLALLATLRKSKFDALIYLMPRIRTSKQIDRDLRFFRLAGINKALCAEYLRQNSLTLPIPKPTPVVDREASFLIKMLASEGIGGDIDPQPTGLSLNFAETAVAKSWLDDNVPSVASEKRLIAVAPSSKWTSKIWPEYRFERVVNALIVENNCFPIIFGGSEDRDTGDRLLKKWGTGANSAGTLSIRESAALLEKCHLYLGNDTGTMHLAAAVGTPCVAIFAAIDWIGRWAPQGEGHTIFRKTVECEGCLTPNCFNNHKCLDLVGEDDVFAACAGILEKVK